MENALLRTAFVKVVKCKEFALMLKELLIPFEESSYFLQLLECN